jgi:hypothetical protein
MTSRLFPLANTMICIAAALIQPHAARACTLSYSTVEVASSFAVQVTDGSHPISGLRLVLVGHGKHDHAIHALTNADGRGKFSNLEPGSFVLEAEHHAGMSDSVFVDVSTKGPANVTVPLTWPNVPTLNVKSASGIIRGPDYYPGGEQPPLSLTLLNAMSQRAIAHTQSDTKGRFAFTQEVPAGLYFLHLNPSGIVGWSGEQIEGSIAVAVSPKATEPALDVDLGWSSCGLEYADRETLPEIQTAEICGDIADAEDAPISNAPIFLLDARNGPTIVEQTKSDHDARFEIQERNEGTYQLLIKSPGFQPYLRAVQIQGKRTSAGCTEPIHIRMRPLP